MLSLMTFVLFVFSKISLIFNVKQMYSWASLVAQW